MNNKTSEDNNISNDPKIRNKKFKNGTMYEKNGWKYISVNGNPKERGYTYGYY
jgi:hypothetical protein